MRSRSAFRDSPIGAAPAPRRVIPEYVQMINANGGKLKTPWASPRSSSGAAGAQRGLQDQHRQRRQARHDRPGPEDLTRSRGVRPAEVPRPGARRADKDVVHKNNNVLGSAGKAVGLQKVDWERERATRYPGGPFFISSRSVE